MSNLKRCDECGKEMPAEGVGTVQGGHLRYEMDVWGHRFEGDFCSWKCIAAYATACAAIEAMVPKIVVKQVDTRPYRGVA